MASLRGALIVLEGCDKAGKSTHVELLVKALKELGKPATLIRFPDRSTTIGKTIDQYLKCQTELTDESIHLLFSANRWELKPQIISHLSNGVSVIVDRYAFSGVAFTAAKGLDLEWCKNPEVGLPKPDTVLYLQVPNEVASGRSEYGQERYENTEFQDKVRAVYEKLKDDTYWKTVNTNREIADVHSEILNLALESMNKHKEMQLEQLWKKANNQTNGSTN